MHSILRKGNGNIEYYEIIIQIISVRFNQWLKLILLWLGLSRILSSIIQDALKRSLNQMARALNQKERSLNQMARALNQMAGALNQMARPINQWRKL